MATSGFKSKKGEILRSWLDFIFGFENKKGDLLDHWIAFHDCLNLSPSEIYAAIEKELEARKIPGMSISKQEFAEGGLISDNRIYLKLFRERLAIYTCAAPFGTGCFFSCRVVYVPAMVRLWHILASLALFGAIGLVLVKLLGLAFAIIAIVALLFAVFAVFRNAAASAVSDIDTFLLKIPGLSTIYEDWFRAETYWREDTRAVYVQRIPALIREIVDEITAAKGVKLVEQYQFAPIFGELYKPLRPNPEPT